MYIALDVETGGIGSDKSLLTAFLAVLDKNFNIIDQLDLKVKPDDGIYKVTAEALGINGINLVKHEAEAIPESKVGTLLYNFLQQHNPNGKSKLIPVGHNVGFDIKFLQSKVISAGNWDKFVSYRLLDTGVIAQYMKVKGRIPESVSGSLGSLAKFFDVPKQVAHTADGDVRMTIDVLKGLLEL